MSILGGGRGDAVLVGVMESIFKVDGPGHVVTILMSKGLASTSDTFDTKTKNDSF
jgi:hypothetical protein